MLPDVGATELMIVAIVALVVVGPKDLPVLMRKVGQWVGKMRGLAAEFRSSCDEMARQSELDELRKEVEALRNTHIPDPLTNLHPTFEEVSAGLDPSGFSIADGSPTPAPPPAAVEAAPEPAAPSEPAKPRPRRKKAAAADAPAETPAPKRRAPPKRKAAPPAEAGS
jgi:sec-independent protein translocase protein TatB